jgi:TrmH family RNA methyltransferase
MTEELLFSDFEIDTICATEEWMEKKRPLLQGKNINTLIVTRDLLKKISSLDTPNKVLAIARFKDRSITNKPYADNLAIALDDVQDPGNMGTIMRLADWFGISTIICSSNCVDIYNPKVVQATMGSIFRLKNYSVALPEFLSGAINDSIPVYGASLEGKNIYQEELTSSGILVFGNESKGISDEVMKFVTKKIFIPSFSHNTNRAESLNIAVAAGIVCSEFRRRRIK